MSFNLGRPIFVLAIVALLSGAVLTSRPSSKRAQLVVWTFVESHAESYRRHRDTDVDVKLLNVSAENIRLGAMFDRVTLDPNQPDVVEIEIGSIGRYFRAPINAVPFLPLNPFLDRDGWCDRIVASRLHTWSKQGEVFGLPHDVHPVTITYRRDLFEQAGIDLPAAKTWQRFQQSCLEFQKYWIQHGLPKRRALELPTSAADVLVMMLLQRHVNILDNDDQMHLHDPRVSETIAFYAQLSRGAGAIGIDSTPGENGWIRDFVRGDVCAVLTPDWRAGNLKRYGPELAGKVAMMPLPVFESTDAPTATWGGTMAAIPRRCTDPQRAWELMTSLYCDRAAAAPRWKDTMILPAIKDLWSEPIFHEPDPFFSSQRVGELYIDLAKQIPSSYWSAFTPIANAQLVGVLAGALDQVDRGVTDAKLRSTIDAMLRDAEAQLSRRIEFGKFE